MMCVKANRRQTSLVRDAFKWEHMEITLPLNCIHVISTRHLYTKKNFGRRKLTFEFTSTSTCTARYKEEEEEEKKLPKIITFLWCGHESRCSSRLMHLTSNYLDANHSNNLTQPPERLTKFISGKKREKERKKKTRCGCSHFHHTMVLLLQKEWRISSSHSVARCIFQCYLLFVCHWIQT